MGATLGGVLVLGAGLAWLLGSAGGRDAVLDRALGALPGAALAIGAREGSLGGGLRLHDLVYEDEAWQLRIERLEAHARPTGLLAGRLHLTRLSVQGVHLVAKPIASPPPSPPWSEALPRLELPIDVQVDALDVGVVTLTPRPEGEGPAPDGITLVDQLFAEARLEAGRLDLRSLRLQRAGIAIEGGLSYRPREDFATSLVLQARHPAGGHLDLDLDGSLAAGRLRVAGRAGGGLEVEGRWTDASTLQDLGWALALRVQDLDPAAFGLPPFTAEPWAATLDLRGGRAIEVDTIEEAEATDGKGAPGHPIALAGEARWGEWPVLIHDGRLRLEGTEVQVTRLALGVLDGRLELQGRVGVGLDAGSAALEAKAEGLAWGEGADRVRADGTVAVSGHPAAWGADLALDLSRAGAQARLRGRLQGEDDGLTLAPFVFTTPGGRLEGEGRWVRGAAERGHLEARFADVDPGWLAPDWPGRLAGRLQVEGERGSDGGLRVQAALENLEGMLRGMPLSGDARWRNEAKASALEGRFAFGGGRLAVAGTLAPRLALVADVDALPMAPLLPEARGALSGRLTAGGTPDRPSLSGRLAVSEAGWGGVALGEIQLELDGEPGEGLAVLRGRRGEARAEARGRWRLANGLAEGHVDLDTLDADLPKLPALRLDPPARLAWDGAGWRIERPACFALAESGRLCAEGGEADLRVEGTDLDLAWLSPWLPQDGASPLRPEGRVSLLAQRRGGVQGAVDTITLRAPSGRIAVGGHVDDPVFGWRDLQLEATRGVDGWQAHLVADPLPDGRLEARIAAPADGTLDGDLALRLTDLSLLEALSADVAAARGVLEGQLRLAGTRQTPRWSGRLTASPFAMELPALGIAVVDGALQVTGAEDGTLALAARLPTGDGVLALDGGWSTGAGPARLRIHGEDVRILDTPDARVWATPALDVDVVDGVARLRGQVAVPRASVRLDRFAQAVAPSADVVVVDAAAEEAAASPVPLDADFALALGEDVRLSGYGFDGHLRGSVQVRDAVEAEPRLRGTLRLDGLVKAYGQTLALKRGNLQWRNAPPANPALDVLAVRPDSTPEVGVRVGGSALAPEIDVWSSPPLPQGEALSWLMFGRPLASADGAEAAQLQEAATTLGGSAVAQAVATRIGLDAASIGESRALEGTALTVGKRITPKLYVSYGLALSGTGQVVTVTYALRRWLAARFEAGLEQRVELEARFERE